jgi:FMN phosphatase YigB (HAD superfamily)
VSQTIDLPCPRILFFDDAEENVQGARKVGMQAICVEHAHSITRWIRPLIDGPET